MGKDRSVAKTASFSRSVKDELAKSALPKRRCAQEAEITAFAYAAGSLYIRDDEMSLHFVSTHPPTARRIFNLWRQLYPVRPRMLARKRTRLSKGSAFLVRVTGAEGLLEVLRDMGLWRWEADGEVRLSPKKRFLEDEQQAKAYLRACFLAGGSISDPRSGYHVEIRPGSLHHANYVRRILVKLGIEASVTSSEDSPLVYLKDADSVGDFLRAVSAVKGLFAFEDIRIMRDMRNRINRLVNSETANMDKVIRAAVRQLADLQALGPERIETLSSRTRELARLRMRNPRASLRELGEMADPPVTKSTVEYHFRKVRQMAARGGPGPSGGG